VIREVHGATLEPADIHPGMPAHQATMVERCPYLRPSVERGLTVWSAYTADPGDGCELFALLVRYAEAVRQARRADGPLVCRNIAIHGPDNPEAAKALMDWPAWLARNLYAPVQLVIDRFWIDIGRNPTTGQSVMPHLPVSFFMVRCGIAHRDRLIVSQRPAPELAALRAGPGDDGRDVFASTLSVATADPVKAWDELTALFPVPPMRLD
jgi:hypothetical protein